jgi:hypothetical protein
MDPTQNPFAPGAGTRPPELAGRDGLIEAATIAIKRTKAGKAAKSQMLLGLRGVGKTVLLNRIMEIADGEGYLTVFLEAPENRRLAEMLVPPLKVLLVKLSGIDHARNIANKALRALRSFASAFEVKVGGAEITVTPAEDEAASGNLEFDLPELLLRVAEAAEAAQRPVFIAVDEVQYLELEDLSALIVSIHKVGQRRRPIVVFGAGLPQLAALAGEAKSYAERLFDYPAVGPLDQDAAVSAIRDPVRREGAEIEDAALKEIVARTKGYPYFLQEWGSHAWNDAPGSPITLADVARASDRAVRALDEGFFKVRLDRLTPREREYLRAMAELGSGPHRSGDIADILGMAVTSAAPLRSGLIKKGMVYSPAHGDTAYTVPMFDAFMRRAMPAWTAPAKAAKAADRRQRNKR